MVQVSLEGGLDIAALGPAVSTALNAPAFLRFGLRRVPPPGWDHDEVLVVVGPRTHIVDSSNTQFKMMGLVSKQLVGEGMKETVSCSAVSE